MQAAHPLIVLTARHTHSNVTLSVFGWEMPSMRSSAGFAPWRFFPRAFHDLSPRQLQYVVAVAETLGFHRAAERCHVSQPTLSAQVKQLEDVPAPHRTIALVWRPQSPSASTFRELPDVFHSAVEASRRGRKR